jgi:rhamnosyl/mannosyltransferase
MESHVQTLAYAQAAMGLSVHVICVNHEAGPTKEETDGPVRVTRLGSVGSFAKLDLCPDLFRAISRSKAEIAHVHVPNPVMIVGALHAFRGRILVTYHSDHVRQRLRSRVFRPIERRFLRRAHTILATSEAYARASPTLRTFARKVRVVPLGIELRPFLEPGEGVQEEARRLLDRYPAPIWFLCGRLVYYKGVETALDALERVPGTLLIAGDGPEGERLRARSRCPRAHFLGNVTDVRPYYRAARALWFPSNARSEAFGLVQVEAMASACPVINTFIEGSGVPWVSRDGETGFTVAVGNARAFAAAATRLLEDSIHERLALRARERASAHFGRSLMAQRTVAHYENALAQVAAG